jgi:hypothetical protein
MLSRAETYGLFALTFSCLLGAGCRHEASGVASVNSGCPDQQRKWTTEELTEIAIAKVGRSDRYEVDHVKTWQEGCKIFVIVTWRPHVPGGHFSAVVSAIDGSVSEVIGGL